MAYIEQSQIVIVIRDKRKLQRSDAENVRCQRAKKDMTACTSQVELDSSSSSSCEKENDEHSRHNSVERAVAGVSKPKRAWMNIMSAGLSSALDRTRVTSRNATFVVTEVASSLGHDVSSFNINRSSIHRARLRHRETIATNLRSEFSPSVSLSVHWDGKLMEDLTTKEHVDRLPVLVSGTGVEQLLGVPKLLSGTGVAQADVVMSCLQEWGVVDQITALCFDTTAANTGQLSGTCTIVQQRLKRPVLFMACRHHVMELILGAAFKKAVGGISTGPDILIFKRFKEQWQFIDGEKFQPASSDPSVEALIASSRADILQFATAQLTLAHPRDDYEELLELSVIFVGSTPARGIHFRAPGAMHRARWMAKTIYALKVWMFRDQFRMTAAEEKGMRDLAIFVVLIYLRAWLTAPFAVEAPHNDFILMRSLLRYPHAAVSNATSKKLGLHLWYLSEELVCLALFDRRVSLESKRLMLVALLDPSPDQPAKRPRVDLTAFLGSRGLEQFCTTNSMRLFEVLKLPNAFLSRDPSEWDEDSSFQKALEVVKNVAVVNDRAERGVALIQEFNKKLTTNEDQLQFLLQVVREHRRQFPDCDKKTLLGNRAT